MTKSVVIGGNGFIGARLADALVKRGREVTVFDRFSHGIQNYTSPQIRQIVGDFLNVEDLRGAVKGQDEVFHFLSATTPATAENDPTIDIRINTIQSVELFDACAREGVDMLYFASTGGAIYGDHTESAVSEDRIAAPKSPYAIAKLSLEHYLEFFRVTKGLSYRIFRISNPYGPGQNPAKPQGLIPIVLRRISLGQPVIQLGDGSMVRDYIYIDDLVNMITAAAGAGGKHRVYNVGSGEGRSVTSVLDEIRSVTGTDFAIERRPTPPSFVDRVVLDVGRYTNDFSVTPFIPLNQGIANTWESIHQTK